jgi:hypothetical protein
MELLKQHGHQISHDWTQDSSLTKPNDQHSSIATHRAQRDLDAVKHSDVLFFSPNQQGKTKVPTLNLVFPFAHF